jgi:hypothetical protein
MQIVSNEMAAKRFVQAELVRPIHCRWPSQFDSLRADIQSCVDRIVDVTVQGSGPIYAFALWFDADRAKRTRGEMLPSLRETCRQAVTGSRVELPRTFGDSFPRWFDWTTYMMTIGYDLRKVGEHESAGLVGIALDFTLDIVGVCPWYWEARRITRPGE